MHLRSALHDTSWLVCCCCADKENDDDCCCADKENVDGGGYARNIAHGDLQDLAHAGDDASARHNTSWLVCCCCADKESDDGGGYARYIAHRDLQDLCTWCSECVERRGPADRCRTRADAAGDEAAADLETRTISLLHDMAFFHF